MVSVKKYLGLENIVFWIKLTIDKVIDTEQMKSFKPQNFDVFMLSSGVYEKIDF